MINFESLCNPVMRRADNLRDPAVLRLEDRYLVYYTRYRIGEWFAPENWTVGMAVTRDFVTFEEECDLTGPNHASPGDPVWWHGRWILPLQTYPQGCELVFSESPDAMNWPEPQKFLGEALDLPWNTRRRAIDPTLVVDGDTLHCFFVGGGPGFGRERANLLGHAVSRDPALRDWRIVSVERPLIGASEAAPDGVENLTVVRHDGQWWMIYSEGLDNQHLALATSPDMFAWTLRGRIDVPAEEWLAFRHGAPAIWRENGQWAMLLMGEESADHRSSLGLFSSTDLLHWSAGSGQQGQGVPGRGGIADVAGYI